MRRILVLVSALGLGVALIPSVALADGVCGEAFTPIYEIQGDGSSSPHEGDVVTTEGVVTMDLQQSSEYFGFFLGAIKGDGDKTTSNGVFVNLPEWVTDVKVGDHVRVTGEVVENFGQTQVGAASNDASVDAFCGKAKVKVKKLKVRAFNSNPEQYEGMLIQFRGKLFVTDTFNLHTFGEVWLGDDGVIEQPTDVYPGGSAAMHELALDNMAQSVLIDGYAGSNPDPVPFLTSEGTLRVGDVTKKPRGAIQYSFGNYRMVNSDNAKFRGSRPDLPNVRGETRVVSFNVLNYWTTLGGRGAATADQLAAQQDKIVAAIREMDADIIGLQEIENDHPADVPIITLVQALNDAEGADVWSRIEGFEQNVYPIVNEIIYRNDKVTPVGEAMTLIDPAFDEFRFPPSTDPDNQLGRRPVAQTFDVGGATFTVVVNHFKSKSTTGATGDDLDLGDGQSGHNARRVQQAQALLDWLPYLESESGDPDILILGDFNAYLEEDPILLLESELYNLAPRYVDDPYSFNFFAGFAAPFIGRGALDHAFSTVDMGNQIKDADYWAINADEPRFLDWFDPTRLAPGPYRSSDHDPLIIGLNLRPEKNK